MRVRNVDYSVRFAKQRIVYYLHLGLRSGLILTLLLVAGALVMGLVSAYLLVNQNWYLAAALILALPGLILLHNYPLLGLGIWLLLMPFLTAIDSTTFRRAYWVIHRALPLVIVAVIVVRSSMGISQRRLQKPGWIELTMVGYVGLSLASIAFLSEDPLATFYTFYDRVIIPMFLYLIVRLLAPSEKEFRKLLPVVLFICVSQAAFGIIYTFAPGLLPKVWHLETGARATGSLRSPSVYGVTLLFSSALVLHGAMNLKIRNAIKLLYIAGFLLAIPAVFFIFSRASWLAGVVVFAGLFFLYPKFLTKLAVIVFPAVLLLAGALLVTQLDYASSRLNSDQTALSRLPVYLASIRMFETKPVFGWGYGNFDRFDRQFQGRVGDLYAPEKDHASHNLYLSILAEQGLVGISLYLAPVIGLLILSIKKWRHLTSQGFWSRKLLAVLWLAIASHIVVNNFSNMIRVFGLGLWWITLAFIATLLLYSSHPTERSSSGDLPWSAK
jgi:O-antigen ligase